MREALGESERFTHQISAPKGKRKAAVRKEKQNVMRDRSWVGREDLIGEKKALPG